MAAATGPTGRHRTAAESGHSPAARAAARTAAGQLTPVPGPFRLKLCRVAVGEEGRIKPTRADFENNLRFRVALRRFLRWSEDQAGAAGLTPAQHQLLVAIKGHRGPEAPAIRDLADYLLLQRHSAVGLVDRAEVAGMVRRQQDENDARVVRVHLTDRGERLVTELTTAHLAELYNLAKSLNSLLEAVRQENNGTGE